MSTGTEFASSQMNKDFAIQYSIAGAIRLNGKERKMLAWAIAFLILAILAGLMGFGGVAAVSIGIAKLLFFLFLVLFVLTLVASLLRRA